MKKLSLLSNLIFLFSYSLSSQNVGIGTTTPLARLHVRDSSVLFSSTGDIPTTPNSISINGTGRRMLWYSDKAAFRVGYVDGNQWDQSNIGNYSFATGKGTKAFGNSSTALGYYSNATGDYSVAAGSSEAMGHNSVGIGSSYAGSDYSTAIGNQNSATGYSSTSLGFNSIASANYSMSFGYTTTASGDYSTALGIFSTASGNSSIAAGLSVIAKAGGGTAFGLYNDNSDDPSAFSLSPSDRIFQIGNGANTSNRKNAMTIFRNGNTGIGTTNPLARLHVIDSSVLFSSSSFPIGPGNPPPIQGPGSRMMWYVDKAAFRVGAVDGAVWDHDSIGNFSFAAGYNAKAKAVSSVSIGSQNNALGVGSVVIGLNNHSSGSNAVAIGESNSALGSNSIAQGRFLLARSYGETVLGIANTDYSPGSANNWVGSDRLFVIGNGLSTGIRSDAMVILKNGNTGVGISNPRAKLHVYLGSSGYTGGYFPGLILESFTNNYINILSPDNYETAILFGTTFTAANGGIVYNNVSTAYGLQFRTGGNNTRMVLNSNGFLGVGVTDPAYIADIGGRLRIRADANSAGLWLNNDINDASPAFIGMKQNDEVGIFGQTGTFGWRFYINTTTGNGWLQGTLLQNSDQRLKTHIIKLDHSLQKLIQLNGYHYNWRDPFNDQALQTGVLAQEVQKLFPELVSANKEGALAVNYFGLIPVMIESIKEQQAQIEKLFQLNSAQQKQIDELKKRLD